ncbi:MAG: hypothetical protein [Cressdnaviricota sp.]|nr:MAG: hypothetical protein [Cressdnaviricota sp.]
MAEQSTGRNINNANRYADNARRILRAARWGRDAIHSFTTSAVTAGTLSGLNSLYMSGEDPIVYNEHDPMHQTLTLPTPPPTAQRRPVHNQNRLGKRKRQQFDLGEDSDTEENAILQYGLNNARPPWWTFAPEHPPGGRYVRPVERDRRANTFYRHPSWKRERIKNSLSWFKTRLLLRARARRPLRAKIYKATAVRQSNRRVLHLRKKYILAPRRWKPRIRRALAKALRQRYINRRRQRHA